MKTNHLFDEKLIRFVSGGTSVSLSSYSGGNGMGGNPGGPGGWH